MTVGWPRAGPLLGGMIMTKPNLIYILADDMGYGDISALNENCGFRTPNLDEMAENGICFTDAHATAAVCTPSRYGILTGRYNWRSRLRSGYGQHRPFAGIYAPFALGQKNSFREQAYAEFFRRCGEHSSFFRNTV